MQQLRQEILNNLNNIEKETEALVPTVWTPRPNNVATHSEVPLRLEKMLKITSWLGVSWINI